jgi:3-hydroxyisobutyrate dehydrogenase-like beta-hydroxyacid dehydrogenase
MKVSVVGLGIMGRAVASKLLESGYEVTVWNRTASIADQLVSKGAKIADSPKDAASKSDITISLVTNPEAVTAITLGDKGILAGLPSGSVHAEMSTVSPDSAETIAQTYEQHGKRFVQAPVMGSRVQIENKVLLVAAGGNDKDIDHCMDVWMAFSKQVWRLDTAKQASALKLAVNILLSQMILALGQSFGFSKAYGIDPATFLEVIMQSSLASPQYQAKGNAILKGDFTANFTVANLLKDVNLAKDAFDNMDGELQLNDTAQKLFERAIADGFGAEDYSAVVKSVMLDAGVKL